jgi:protein-S-isoprenylcysteine O-methyltransferase Ste14
MTAGAMFVTINLIEYRPPRIAMALLAVATALHLLLPVSWPFNYSSAYLSGALVTAGFAIMMLAWWQFREREVAICPTAKTDHLITNGIYRFTRNPMYLGMLTMLFGVAVFVGTLPFFAATIVYLFLIDRCFCRFEEDKLIAAFGRDYGDYRARVRRWI